MMGRSRRCYIPSFMKIGPLVPEKEIFECFFTKYGHGGHFGHVTSIILINFHFYVPKSLHTKFVKTALWFLRKEYFNFQEMTLTFNTHISSLN